MARQLIYRGAEADLYHGTWCRQPAISKVRRPKPYRHPILDTQLRQQRTVHEAQMLHRARRAGIASPIIYHVNHRRAELVLQYLPGPTLGQLLHEPRTARSWAARWGELLARLHQHHLVHGDPNPTNFIQYDARLVILDFGLAYSSARPEDYATDLHLIHTLLHSAYPAHAPRLWRAFLAGYRSHVAAAKLQPIERQLADLARRGRYARLG